MTVPRGQNPARRRGESFAFHLPREHPLRQLLHDLVYGYGSFMLFTRPAANLLLVACTMTRPWLGIFGVVGGVSTLLLRRWLALAVVTAGGLEVVNGILAGLLVGYFFAPGWRTLALAVCAGPFAILVSAWMGAGLRRHNLPLLSGSFVIVGTLLLAAGRAMALPYAPLPPQPVPFAWLPVPLYEFLRALGGIYLIRTPEGGAFVLAALALSSRTMVLLALLADLLAQVVLSGLAIPVSGLAGSAASSAAIMAAIMTGGLFASPGGRAVAVAMFSAACACVASIALFNAFYFMSLLPLSLPYLAITWLVMLTLRPERGAAWERYWLPESLPERSLERRRQAEARGLSAHSVALRAPFLGRWHLYQGFDGQHTHQAPWQHALDFHRLVDGQAYRGDGAELQDFYCFGQVVRSPAWGQVVALRSDLPDLPPGEVDAVNSWGNYILIGIGGGDYVLMGHLRQNSLTVACYDHVTPGQSLGQCGNSGRSPQPHIHLHVQTGFALGSPTRPFHLSGVCIDGQFLLDGVPKEHDLVSVPHVSEALKRSLHIQIGRRLAYAVGQRELLLEVDLDPTNHFAFVADSGARILLVETDNLLALYERSGPGDPAFDAFVLAVGLTPLMDAEVTWRDAPPVHLLPLPWHSWLLCWLLPGLVAVESCYRREWDGVARAWRQAGDHHLTLMGRRLWCCRTTALITEGDGVVGFALVGEGGGGKGVEGRLVRVGFKSDTGVEGWDEVVRSV
ncbi:MAG: urea transporter [Magnetococcales bacterium]|nr:urea transporter [Magnetococcales bacterium]